MIKLVEVSNWKAFDKTRIDFLDGVNFLVGQNAAGKTSILEAICLAFTGEALTVDDPRKLVKGGQSYSAEIVVEFLNNLKVYRIERILSRDRRISSKVYCNKELKAEGWEEVTSFLSKLLGIDKNFFERAVYMSERDILRFISNLPKKAIVSQVEEALKIDKMTDLVDELNKEKECYQKIEEEQKRELDILKGVVPQQQIDSFKIKESLVESKKSTELSEVQLGNATNKIYSRTEHIEDLTKLIKRTEELEKDLTGLIDASAFKSEFLQEIRRARDSSQNKLNDIIKVLEPKIKEKGALEERIQSTSKIVDLLISVEKELQKTSECPICGKTLSAGEARGLLEKFNTQMQIIQKNLSSLDFELLGLEKTRRQILQNLEKLESVETELALVYKKLGQERLSSQILYEQKNDACSELEEQKRLLTETKSYLDQKRKEQYDLEKRLELDLTTQKFGGIEGIEASLVSTSKVLIALELLEKASSETIEKQRKSKLEPIYRDITDVWNKMKGTEDYKIEIDGSMVPVLFRNNQKFELSQLSGGEKTALLVIIRTVLCRRFMHIGFMLLDEPLEHLDPDNRRRIIDFLVESFEKGWVDQLIVSTFEESLLRKFHGHEKVNVIAL